MPKAKQFRRRRQPSESDEDNSTENVEKVSDVLEATRELQRIRKRQMGVSSASLATGIKLSKADEMIMDEDPFKLNNGGLVNLRNIKDRNRDRTYEDIDRDVTSLGSTFSVETNRRDEDSELTAYVENELKKIKGEVAQDGDGGQSKRKTAEDALYQLPEHLKVAAYKQSEEMLSNQMLSGIPEIDLGIDVKIKNIERTEEAKQKMIKDLSKKKESTTSFVPTNMAVNYVQHKRYMQNDNTKQNKKAPVVERPPLVVGDKERRRGNVEVPVEQKQQRSAGMKSTDNFHFDKFRRHNHRR